jgi:hypothetical protein
MEKAVVEEIKEGKQKEKEEKRAKWVAKLGSIVDETTWKWAKNRAKVEFIVA